MRKEIAARWVAALRSGEFKQGKSYLNNDGQYCCLGVLCELAMRDAVTEAIHVVGNRVAYGTDPQDTSIRFPPITVWRDWAGMHSQTGALTLPAAFDVMNDSMSCTFAEIADVIERNWEVL